MSLWVPARWLGRWHRRRRNRASVPSATAGRSVAADTGDALPAAGVRYVARRGRGTQRPSRACRDVGGTHRPHRTHRRVVRGSRWLRRDRLPESGYGERSPRSTEVGVVDAEARVRQQAPARADLRRGVAPSTGPAAPRTRHEGRVHAPVPPREFDARPAETRAVRTRSRREHHVHRPSAAPSASVTGRKRRAGSPRKPASPRFDVPAMHDALIGVALPRLFIGAGHGQIDGAGLDGFYGHGRRLLSRCHLRVAGREPTPLRAGMVRADRAAFFGLVNVPDDPDPILTVERTRVASGRERIALRSTAQRTLRVPVELSLSTDLADIEALAEGIGGESVPAAVCASGLRWSSRDGDAVVEADPRPHDVLARAGLLHWDLELRPGEDFVIDLRVRRYADSRALTGRSDAAGLTSAVSVAHTAQGSGPVRRAGRSSRQTSAAPGGPLVRERTGRAIVPVVTRPGPRRLLSGAEAICSDPRASRMLRTCLQDLRGLLVPDLEHAGETYLAAGVPWRCGLSPGVAASAARMCLPLGTELAVGTLRTLARAQHRGSGRQSGLVLAPRTDPASGMRLRATAHELEATLLFPVLLAEARRWGLADRDAAPLVPAAERCLDWLRRAVGDGLYVPDPGPRVLFRAATQAHAHRAALLGADLLDAYGRPGAESWRQWARQLRSSFRLDFWAAGRDGGRPVTCLTEDGRRSVSLNSTTAHLLDPGLSAAGEFAPGLLDEAQTVRLAQLISGPVMNSGWGIRSLGATERGFSPLGRRTGAVHLHDTAVAAAGLAAVGRDADVAALIEGTLRVADAFGHRLPDIVGGYQRVRRSAPVPHPAACRPAATAAAGALHILTALIGVRPDAPAGTVTLRPLRSTPLGDLTLTGLVFAGGAFTARVNAQGLAMVEEVEPGMRLRT
ncbi:glycogen debranching protein [Streptomyces triticagri]|uniref:Glycogen debranching protein n=1 Tax=Streptomyces triticagri TaxID=2293568 RepID=A0A372M0L2_9ACTN|nr:glycogen debranching protein [Streptomyces triticagri]